MFESFASVIPFQQLSIDAGVAILGRLMERFAENLEQGGNRYHAFPAVHAIAQARLDPKTPLGDVVGRFGDVRGYLYFCGLGANLLKKGFIHAAARNDR